MPRLWWAWRKHWKKSWQPWVRNGTHYWPRREVVIDFDKMFRKNLYVPWESKSCTINIFRNTNVFSRNVSNSYVKKKLLCTARYTFLLFLRSSPCFPTFATLGSGSRYGLMTKDYLRCSSQTDLEKKLRLATANSAQTHTLKLEVCYGHEEIFMVPSNAFWIILWCECILVRFSRTDLFSWDVVTLRLQISYFQTSCEMYRSRNQIQQLESSVNLSRRDTGTFHPE